LKPGQIDVWRVDLTVSDESYAQFYSVLDRDEKHRADKFIDDETRRQWVAAHGQIRVILAKYTGMAAEQIILIQKRGEKPYIKDSKVKFNLSHTTGYALLAVTQTGEVGIDIEYKRDNVRVELISRSSFSQSERQAILAVEGRERRDRFFNCWTRKEAFIKAIGKGFSYDTKTFSVTVESKELSRVIAFEKGDYNPNTWNILSFIPYPNTQAALAFDFTLTILNHLELSINEKFMVNEQWTTSTYCNS